MTCSDRDGWPPSTASHPPRWPFAILSLLFVALVFWTSSGDVGEVVVGLPGPGVNALHILSGGLLALLLLRSVVPVRGWGSSETWPGLKTPVGRAILAGVLLHALFNESHQALVPGRYCALSDIVLDGAGAAVALLAPVRGAAGRPTRWIAALTCAVVALALAWVAATFRLPGDGALAAVIARVLS